MAVPNWAVTVEHDRLSKGNGSQLGLPIYLLWVFFYFFFTFMHACKHAFMLIEVSKQLSGIGSFLMCVRSG